MVVTPDREPNVFGAISHRMFEQLAAVVAGLAADRK